MQRQLCDIDTIVLSYIYNQPFEGKPLLHPCCRQWPQLAHSCGRCVCQNPSVPYSLRWLCLFGVSSNMSIIFCATTESILRYSITSWFGNLRVKSQKYKLVKTVSKTVGSPAPLTSQVQFEKATIRHSNSLILIERPGVWESSLKILRKSIRGSKECLINWGSLDVWHYSVWNLNLNLTRLCLLVCGYVCIQRT